MLKIFLVSNMYPSDEFPGFGTFVKNSELILKDSGFEVDVVAKRKKACSLVGKICSYIRLYYDVAVGLSFRKYDYIYAHYVSHMAIPLLMFRLFGGKVKIVSHVHGGDVTFLRGRSKFFFQLKCKLAGALLQISDCIVFPSKFHANYVLSKYNLLSKSYVICPSGGISPEVFNMKDRRERRVIGYAGRLVKSKNVDLIIKAVVQIEKGISLEIVGDGECGEALKALVVSKGLSHRVTFLPPKPQKELADWFRSIQAIVYPSDSESLGLVPIEAIACGALPIVSAIPAFLELEGVGVKLNYVKPLAHSKIAEELSKILALGPVKKEILQKKNSKIVIEHYSSSSARRKLIDAFR